MKIKFYIKKLIAMRFTNHLIFQKICFHLVLFLVFGSLSITTISAQDNFVGDGFGGRTGYNPGNVEVGVGVGSAIVGGQLYMWGNARVNYYAIPDPASLPVVDENGVPGAGEHYLEPSPISGFENTKLISLERQAGAIKTDDTGWVWGAGTGTYTDPFGQTPIQVITNAKHVSAAEAHVAFVKNDGTVWSVGYNRYGAFGDGTTSTTTTTTAVQMTGMTNAVRVCATGSCANGAASNANLLYRGGTLVLKDDGTVWVAGAGGSLIAGSTNNSATQIAGLSNIVDIQAGKYHAVALDTNGDLWSWGARYYAPHGNGENQTTTGYHHTPVQVQFPTGTPPMIAIETEPNSDITFSIDEAGTLWAWGYQASMHHIGQSTNTSEQFPVIAAKYVRDITHNNHDNTYLTRTDDYPENSRLWYTGYNSPAAGLMPLNNEFTPSSSYINGGTVDVWLICRPQDFGLLNVDE